MKTTRNLIGILAGLVFAAGCQVQPPSGNVIQPPVLGTVVDQVHRQQEENAEYSKFVIYQHEFEINLQDELQVAEDQSKESSFTYKSPNRIRGHRLTPDGESHVSQIAHIIKNNLSGSPPYVVVEQSNSSRRWDTKHRYPVHGNDELDSFRRQVVVYLLQALGVENADQLVIVAPAFSTSLNGDEAAASYRSAISNPGAGGGQFGR